MGFYYAKEKAAFEAKWSILRAEYEKAGMSQTAIDSMHKFDWNGFRAQRIYCDHNQSMPDTYLVNDADEGRSSLLHKFAALSMTFDEADFPGRYAWVDSIDNADLAAKLHLLPAKNLELLTLYAIDGYTQAEIASLLGRNQSVVSRKINRIKKFLKK